jgi:hypothetical protein
MFYYLIFYINQFLMGCIKSKTSLILNPVDPKAPLEEGKKPEEAKKVEPEIKKNSIV